MSCGKLVHILIEMHRRGISIIRNGFSCVAYTACCRFVIAGDRRERGNPLLI